MADLPYVIVRRHSTPAQKDVASRIIRAAGVEDGSYDIAHDLLDRVRSVDLPPVSLEEIVEVLETALVWMPIGFAPTLGIAPADTHNARAGVARERVRSLLDRLAPQEPKP